MGQSCGSEASPFRRRPSLPGRSRSRTTRDEVVETVAAEPEAPADADADDEAEG